DEQHKQREQLNRDQAGGARREKSLERGPSVFKCKSLPVDIGHNEATEQEKQADGIVSVVDRQEITTRPFQHLRELGEVMKCHDLQRQQSAQSIKAMEPFERPLLAIASNFWIRFL